MEHFIDAYITTPVGNGSSKLTAGADFRTSNTDQEFSSVGFYSYSTKYSKDSLHHNQVGLYAALNINAKTGFNLELGNRLNIHSAYGSNYVFNINPSYLLNKKLNYLQMFLPVIVRHRSINYFQNMEIEIWSLNQLLLLKVVFNIFLLIINSLVV
jgi:hypothetical protein